MMFGHFKWFPVVILFFVLFASKQWVSCQDEPRIEPKYLGDLFRRFTNTNVLNQTQINNVLSSLHLVPDDHSHDDHHTEDHAHCYSAEQLLNNSNASSGLNRNQFHDLLPTLVYEIITDACHHEESHEETQPLSWKVIIASIVAVLVISVSGLIVVALLPLMPAIFYNVATQFLIALSVGSLIGDAFLHLIPHALSGNHAHQHEDSNSKQEHLRMISMSMVAVLGVYLFFLTERLTILYQNKSSKRKMKRELVFVPDGANVEKNGVDVPIGNLSNGRLNGTPASDPTEQARSPRLAPAIWSSEYQKVGTSAVTQWPAPTDGSSVPDFVSPCDDNQLCNRPPQRPLDNARCEDHLRGYLEGQSDRLTTKRNDSVDGKQPLCTPHANSSGDLKNEQQPSRTGRVASLTTMSSHSPQVNVEPTPTKGHAAAVSYEEEDGEQLTHLHRDRPHGHHHGHSHDLSSIRAIAYTVIAGDGLHNFCDGIAIGAAFANSFEGGLSTAIAVLCHELPHEVGDFAVLLHAGLPVKSAMLCNLLSSLLCACGTAIGLSVGRISSVDSWVFMLIAGMFVYIALVDMMPELSTSRLKGHRYCHRPSLLFMWQNFGILLGCAVMLMIALFEGGVI